MPLSLRDYIPDEDEGLTLDDLENDVIRVVSELGCSYPAEIARELMISHDTAVALVHRLVKHKRLWKIKFEPYKATPCIRPRLPHFWGMGIKGYETFARMYWVGTNCGRCKCCVPYTLPPRPDSREESDVEELHL